MTSPFNADLVLEGGGVKGIALAGAVSVLEERGYQFHKIAGTSAGAIVGALVAAGAPGKRLREIMEDLDYQRFRDPGLLGRLGPLGVLAEVLLNKGWCRGDYLRSWLAEKLSEYNVDTFAQLRLDDTGADTTLQDRDR
jgi:NTE family protein